MSKQHPKVAILRQFNRWRRGGKGEMPDAAVIGEALDWAIGVCESADSLINVKGRHHAEQSYKRLERAVNP